MWPSGAGECKKITVRGEDAGFHGDGDDLRALGLQVELEDGGDGGALVVELHARFAL